MQFPLLVRVIQGEYKIQGLIMCIETSMEMKRISKSIGPGTRFDECFEVCEFCYISS